MKRKIFLTIAFLISLVPMIASQYGGVRGVREISGLINLCNPIGIIAVIAFLVGLWFPFKKYQKLGKILCIFGLILVIAAELVTFLTWYIPNYRNGIDLSYAFENTFPEFYLGLTTSALMLVTYVCMGSIPEPKTHRTVSRSTTTPTKTSAKSRTVGKTAKKAATGKKTTKK